MESFDIVVVGFGPVGQMMCAQLGRAGHRVAAIERQPQLYGLSRAGHIDDEVMRTLQKVGASSEFLEDAVAWQMYDMRNKAFDGELLMSLDWSKVGRHGWQEHWLFYQNNLEIALARQIASTGNVDVRMGTEVADFTQDEDHITVITRNRRTGTEQVVHAKYLVGADGADSFVRGQLAIPVTEGVTGPYQLVIDAAQRRQLSFDFDNGQFADPLRPGCLFQLGKTHRRWEFTLLPSEEPGEFTIDRVWELLSPWVGPDDVEILRHPVYQFREVMADEWQRD
ncbi:MAG: FAD-dependent monooxygenase, partial [Mycobacterium sp.]|nr:FAD-dependent monooxygenase [Mycobacterium sp.]